MKKYLIIGVLALFAFAACENNIPEPISPPEPESPTVPDFPILIPEESTDKIEIRDIDMGYSKNITNVAVVVGSQYVDAHSYFDGSYYHIGPYYRVADIDILVRIPFDSKCMTLDLPDHPPVKRFQPITSEFPDELTFSDPETQVITSLEIACDISEDGFFDIILYRSQYDDDMRRDVRYIYCDRPVTITGTYTSKSGQTISTYDLNFKKGWNSYVFTGNWKDRYRTYNHQMSDDIKWCFDVLMFLN